MKARIEIDDDVFDRIKELANAQNKSAYNYIQELLALAVAYSKQHGVSNGANERNYKVHKSV